MEFRENPFVLTFPEDWVVLKHDATEGEGNLELGGVDFRIVSGSFQGEMWIELKSRVRTSARLIRDESNHLSSGSTSYTERSKKPMLSDLPKAFREKLLGTAGFLVFARDCPALPIRFFAILELPSSISRDEKATIVDSLQTKLDGLFSKVSYRNLTLKVCTRERFLKHFPEVQISVE